LLFHLFFIGFLFLDFILIFYLFFECFAGLWLPFLLMLCFAVFLNAFCASFHISRSFLL